MFNWILALIPVILLPIHILYVKKKVNEYVIVGIASTILSSWLITFLLFGNVVYDFVYIIYLFLVIGVVGYLGIYLSKVETKNFMMLRSILINIYNSLLILILFVILPIFRTVSVDGIAFDLLTVLVIVVFIVKLFVLKPLEFVTHSGMIIAVVFLVVFIAVFFHPTKDETVHEII